MFKKIKNKLYFLLFVNLFVVTILMLGCSTPKPPDCIHKSALKSEISWGTLLQGNPAVVYNMKMDGSINLKDNDVEKSLTVINPDTLCNILRDMGILIIEIQTLNVPADKNHFFEYKNPDENYYFRAVWNPKHTNDGNKKFEEFYNRLQNLTE